MSSVTRSSVVGVELGYAEITSNVTQTGVGNQDVSGLSVTVEVGTRPINIIFSCGSITNTNVAGLTAINIKESTTTLGQANWFGAVANSSTSMTRIIRVAPSAGSHTYKINLQQLLAGDSTLGASATSPASIQVIEI